MEIYNKAELLLQEFCLFLLLLIHEEKKICGQGRLALKILGVF